MNEPLLKSIKKILVSTAPEIKELPDIDAAITSTFIAQNKDHLPLEYKAFFEDIQNATKAALEISGENRSDIIKSIPFTTNKDSENKFDFIDLFAGIGGFRLGLQEEGGQCIFSSEWERGAKATYFSNYGEVPFGDINQYAGEDIPDHILKQNIPNHDLLAAGFPCQPFSHAGVSARSSLGLAHGFECETQGTLFYLVARIANAKRPKVLFLENVRNLVSHNKGETFEVIKRTIKEIGYQFHFNIVDSSSVVPQRRKRCYMICVRNDIYEQYGEFKFPTFEGLPLALQTILCDSPDPSYTISDKLWQGHINRTKRNIERGTGFSAHAADITKPSNTIVSRYGKDGKECLVPQEGKNPRKLTIDECIRLFGFPHNFVKPSSKSATYKQFGNSVVKPVVHKIAAKVIAQYL